MQVKAVKSNPDPAWGSPAHKAEVLPPGFVLTAFLFSTPSRLVGRSPAAAARGKSYCGEDAETGQGVAKLVPLHRTTDGSSGSRRQTCEGQAPLREGLVCPPNGNEELSNKGLRV